MSVSNKAHHLVLDGRSKLSMSGVSDVASFDEDKVVCSTSHGNLLIRGSQLRIGKLSLEDEELAVEGNIDSMVYENASPKGGFWSRLLG